MTIKRHVMAGLLILFSIFLTSWLVTKATAHEGTHDDGTAEHEQMDVPKKGTTNQFWGEWFGENPFIKEPALEYVLDWKVNEVPRSITIYYDVNNDGFPDVVFAHPIVAENQAPACGTHRDEESRHLMFTTCKIGAGPHTDYFVTHEHSMFRILDQHTCSGCPLK